jgi:hypothetical protein
MTWRLLLRVVMAFVIALALLMQIAAAAPDDAYKTALILAGLVGAASPFVIQFVKSTLGLNVDGRRMVAAAWIVAGVIGLLALFLTGQLDFSDPEKMAGTLASAIALQQGMFSWFKDSSKVGPYLK